MTQKNIFVKSIVIGATAISLAASLSAPVQAKGGRDHVDLKTTQSVVSKDKTAKASFFGKRNAVNKATRGKVSNSISRTTSGVKKYK
ncbi:hypothetical protein F9L33_06215 [Amylibacter sp. SFDW26]|uniref:hypothetical protein n=1 Tax=Amylibacter sp. SFDW26 TaxID=2652722 RepID=UPI00126159D7|nr:hypothetical protein [Amylibacter sp. SFDW26]KAB7616339.1 hypothetical protein F9L33_06215 [Amylibacter sp. SFDW26]